LSWVAYWLPLRARVARRGALVSYALRKMTFHAEGHVAEARRLVHRQKGLIIRSRAAGVSTWDAQRIRWPLEAKSSPISGTWRPSQRKHKIAPAALVRALRKEEACSGTAGAPLAQSQCECDSDRKQNACCKHQCSDNFSGRRIFEGLVAGRPSAERTIQTHCSVAINIGRDPPRFIARV
jgi:hypothetical protein